jgi:hypothetical protein
MSTEFKHDLTAPMPKLEQRPQPVKAVQAPAEVHEVDEVQPAPHPKPQQPEVIGKGTRRKDADGTTGPWVNPQGQVVHTRPKIVAGQQPAKAVPAPIRYDPNAKYVDSGESRAAYRCEGGVVTNMSTGEREGGKVLRQFGGFGTLIENMTSRKLG